MMIYYLSENVHSCFANGHIVFLNIKNDRYSALPPDLSKIMGALVTKRAINAREISERRPDVQTTITNLLNSGILQSTAPGSIWPQPRIIEKPRGDLSEANIEGRRDIAFIHVVNFIYAYCRAKIGTKILGIDHLIRNLSENRPQYSAGGYPKHSLMKIIEALRFIRIFFYKEIDHCYFDCAVHMYFLRCYGFDPVWVFGVKMEPFHAHCWVQVGDILVTNHLGETGMLQPILAI